MKSVRSRRLFVVALALTVLASLPSQAQRRRTVRHPAAKVTVSVSEVTGTVTDSVTGRPVISAHVTAGNRSDTTDSQGKFRLRNVSGFNSLVLEVTRTGYATQSFPLSAEAKQDFTIRLVPGSTVRVRKLDGTTYDLDFDSVRFGFAVPFSTYQAAEYDEFCKTNGTSATIDRSEFRRITGPATLVSYAPCCTNANPLLKVQGELKNGETTELYFKDSCDGYSNIDISGRDHVSAEVVYIVFTDIAEVTFP